MPRRVESPDPLTLEAESEDCIRAAPVDTPIAGPSGSRPKATSTPRTKRAAQPSVEITTPSKKRRTEQAGDGGDDEKSKRTPLARASPATSRASANGASSRKGKEKPPDTVGYDESVMLPGRTKATPRLTPKQYPSQQLTPTKTTTKASMRPVPKSTPSRTPKPPTSQQPTPKPATLKAATPRPVPKRRKASTPPVIAPDKEAEVEPLEEVGDGYTEEAVSRETFLANENLRRQREARNFKYTGSADAPKLTRSGKVIGEKEEDEYGEGPPQVGSRREAGLGDREVEVFTLPAKINAEELFPLPPGAKPYARKMLDSLTGRGIAVDPLPFAEEEKNEALNGLVNLLRGTVERGEGNSALVVGARGVGKTRTIARALNLLPSTSTNSPIIVRLSGLAQTNDRLAIREMGMQISEAEGKVVAEEEEEEGDDAEYAPTTLPSHLLALLTTPSPRAIVIIMEEFDLFTEHARQALLYCLLDVVQSVKTGPVATTGRGVAVIGVTSRIDTLLLLEKRVKSRFSHRMWRVISPLAPNNLGWRELLRRALLPWQYAPSVEKEAAALIVWQEDWEFVVDTLIEHPKIVKNIDRLCSLTTDVRLLYSPFVTSIAEVVSGSLDLLSVPQLLRDVVEQVEAASWGLASVKLKGLSHPALGVLIIAKHLSYVGREEFTFAMVEEEYLRFARTKLVGSGRTRWPLNVLRTGFDHLLRCALLVSAGSQNVKPRFVKVRCTLAPHEIVAWMKGDGAVGLGPEMVGWGRLLGGHA